MEHDILRPNASPKTSKQAFSPFGCFLAASGITLLTFCLLGSASAATVWAVSKLLGLPDNFLYVLLSLGMLPVLAATFWTAGRAWHVERRLAQGKDIDVPVFELRYYAKSHEM
jgi:hypothetical protein